ncbi:MAG: MBL fold metallo-hydrolase [Candidatus Parcubacteria bacterium]|nr:MBL fold metallo-hydrolase [Candidatus Parcubacteria bacterium]
MKITFFGAAENVTGSKHLIQSQGYSLLLDCGLYQGKRKISNELNRNLPFPASQINAVILSHAHLDHCGTLPILVKNGFQGKIYCTDATADIARYILEDSAMLQEQDAIYFNKHLKKRDNPIAPIYTKKDVEETLSHFQKIPYFSFTEQWTQLNENIRFKFYDAGHVLGSAIILLEIKEGGSVKTLVFSGDLGRAYLPILRSPEYIKEDVQSLILECTYGNRLHRPMDNLAGQLKEVINEAIGRKGKILVPAFSLERTQELIYILHNLIDKKIIPSIPIYIDSPLAKNITQVFSQYKEYFDEQFQKDFGSRNESPFFAKNIIYTRSTEESKELNNIPGPFIIIAGSGMVEGGRILHHLKNNISNPDTIVLITGYQAENTLGRRIQEGITPVKIFGEIYPVRAKIITLDEFSAHADQKDLLSYINHTKGLKNLFLVHTEAPQAKGFKSLVKQSYPSLTVDIPTMGQVYEI